MNVYLVVASGRRVALSPEHDCARAAEPCPACGVAGFTVGGSGRRPSADDRAWEADGYCLTCRARVGLIRAEPDTLFGVREDEAVLRGRCRVY